MFQHKRNTQSKSTTTVLIVLLLASLLIPSQLLAAVLPSPTLSAAVQAGPQVSLSWAQPKAVISGFQLQRSLDPTAGFATVKTVSKTVLSATDTAVQAGTGYYYRVRCYKTGTTTSYSNFSNVVFADVPPAVAAVDSTPPSVSITSPSSGTSYASAQTVSITASAQDNVGVSKVEFYQGGVLKKTATVSPYKHDWAVTAADNGSHSFTAKAYDARGNVASSTAVSITVNIDVTAPTVSITSPVAGASFTTAQTLSIAASAQDNVGVSKVEFYDGANLKGTVTASPYAYSWAITSADNGSHSITAKAYDTAGNVANSTAVGVSVNIPLAAPGSFQFASATYVVYENQGGFDVVINRVGGSDGQVTVDLRTGQLSALANQDYVGISATPLTFAAGVTSKVQRISLIADNVAEADETFKVLLANPTGGATLGSPTEAIITLKDSADSVAPTVSMSSPVAGSTVTSAQTLTVSANAQDNVGVSRVEFYDGAVLKATDSTAPYSYAWAVSATDNGSHSLSAKAYDAAGNVAGSSAVAMTVNIPVALPGSFEFAVGAYTVGESDGFVDVTINRVGGSNGQVTVDFRTGQLTAISGQDYTGITLKTLTFAAGETWKTEKVAIINDSIQESEETFKVLISNPTGGASLGSRLESTITVLDDDQATTTPPTISGPVKVFPFAEGFGTDSKAGRGGQVIKVTNLNDSGPGSLRDAVSKTGPRIVVFEVGGVINLSSSIVITNPYITIAGQSAPPPGITLNGYGIEPGTHDMLIQHLFVRITGTGEDDGMRVYRGSSSAPQIYNVVIDHVSIAWGNDENASIVINSGHDFTYSNCLLGEGHYGMLIDANITNVSILRNLIMSATQRHPRLKGGVAANVVNNVLFNAGNQSFAQVGSVDGKNYVSFAGNKFIDGPSTSSGSYGVQVYSAVAGSQLYVPTSGTHKNLASRSVYSSEVTPFLVSSPPSLASLNGITVLPAEEIEVHIYNNAGARPAERDTTYGDTTDERFISELQARVGSVKDLTKPAWSKPVSTVRAFDPGSNPSGDDDGNGYTNIEELLFKMALEVEGRTL